MDLQSVLRVAREYRDEGAYAVALGDTIGVGDPGQVFAVVTAVIAEVQPLPVRLHFHDTYGRALANTVAAMQAGAAQFDGSVGGLGGCPYAPGASGNVATEDMVSMLERMGIETGVDLDALLGVAEFVQGVVGRRLDGKVLRATIASR